MISPVICLYSERWSLLSAKKRLFSHETGVWGLKKIWDLAQTACRARINYRMLSSQSQIQGSHTAEIHGLSLEIQHGILNVNLSFLLWPHTVPSKSGKGCSRLKSETVKDRVGRRWEKPCRRDALFEKKQVRKQGQSCICLICFGRTRQSSSHSTASGPDN